MVSSVVVLCCGDQAVDVGEEVVLGSRRWSAERLMPSPSKKTSRISRLREDFNKLIDTKHPEQIYQTFLEENSELIPREFVLNHGINLDLVLRKVTLAKDYTPDFMYLSKSSGEWNCVLIELEKPHSRLFKPDSTALHGDFKFALEQINDWRAWLQNPSNHAGFVDGTLGLLRIPSILSKNPVHIKYVLVIGRRSEVENNEPRRRKRSALQQGDFRILSYDSLLEGLRNRRALYVGVRHNDHIEIVSNRFVGESLFSLIAPENLRIRKALRDDALACRKQWYMLTPKGKPLMEKKLPQVPLKG